MQCSGFNASLNIRHYIFISSLIQQHLGSTLYSLVEWLGLGCSEFECAVFGLGLLHGDQRPPGLARFLFWVEL